MKWSWYFTALHWTFHYQAGEAAGPGGGEGGGGHYAPAQAEASRPVGEGQHEHAAQDSLFRQVDS